MAIDDIGSLKSELPEVFAPRSLPPGWEDDWIIIPIGAPESGLPSEDESVDVQVVAGVNQADDFEAPLVPAIEADFGGAPRQRRPNAPPPPDSLAFYLPFHYYYPTWWGIYLTLEGTQELAKFILRRSRGALSMAEAMVASRLFLYAHEAYHHAVESFATRLEVSHRTALYKVGFERLYKKTVGTDDCVEEALATAKGLNRALQAFGKNKPAQVAVREALKEYIEQCPPGYRKASAFANAGAFRTEQGRFAEGNHQASLPGLPSKSPAIWATFPHAFSGMARVTSRVNYIVHRRSPLVTRRRLGERYLTYGDLIRKLKNRAGCRFVRHGKHEIWETPTGTRFPVPRHSGDLAKGTLLSIIRKAGLNMSLEEFIRA